MAEEKKRRRKKAERELDLVWIAEKYVKNIPVRSIAEELNKIREYSLSFQSIHNDIKEILKRWQDKKDDIITQHVAIELEKSLVRERKIWEAWEKSEGTQQTKDTKKKGTKTRADSIEVRETEEDGFGYYKFMEQMRKEAEFRCKLLGSFAAIDVNNNVNTNGAVLILPANGRDINSDESGN